MLRQSTLAKYILDVDCIVVDTQVGLNKYSLPQIINVLFSVNKLLVLIVYSPISSCIF